MPTNPTATASWVRKTPGVCGGDACVRDTRHTVAGLVAWHRLGLADAEILRRHPDLSQADLNEAWAYDDGHHDEVDAALRAHKGE